MPRFRRCMLLIVSTLASTVLEPNVRVVVGAVDVSILPTQQRPVFYFIGDSITEFAGDPTSSGWAALLQHTYVRAVDIINRGLSGYNTRWFVQRALPVFEKELQTQYAPSLVTLFFGANDAALATGPAAGQHVPLDEYRTNLAHIIHTLTPHLPPQAKILLITPPAIIDAARSGGDRSNEAAGEYARACVDVARAEDVPVLDLHTFFNTQFRREAQRATFFSDGLHLSRKGNGLAAILLQTAIDAIFDDVELARFRTMQIPDAATFLQPSTQKAGTLDAVHPRYSQQQLQLSIAQLQRATPVVALGVAAVFVCTVVVVVVQKKRFKAKHRGDGKSAKPIHLSVEPARLYGRTFSEDGFCDPVDC